MNGQPHLALFAVELLLQSQTRRFTPGLFVAGAQGAEVQVPQPACKHAVFVIDEQGMSGGVVNNAIELVNDRLGEGLGRNLQAEEFQAPQLEQFSIRAIVFSRLAKMQSGTVVTLLEPLNSVEVGPQSGSHLFFGAGKLRNASG